MDTSAKVGSSRPRLRVSGPEQSPHLARRTSSPGDMMARQLRIPLGHFNVGVAQDLGEFVEVPAVHHVPTCEGVTQIMEPEIADLG